MNNVYCKHCGNEYLSYPIARITPKPELQKILIENVEEGRCNIICNKVLEGSEYEENINFLTLPKADLIASFIAIHECERCTNLTRVSLFGQEVICEKGEPLFQSIFISPSKITWGN